MRWMPYALTAGGHSLQRFTKKKRLRFLTRGPAVFPANHGIQCPATLHRGSLILSRELLQPDPSARNHGVQDPVDAWLKMKPIPLHTLLGARCLSSVLPALVRKANWFNKSPSVGEISERWRPTLVVRSLTSGSGSCVR
jgi:hypothetical protein